MKLITVLKLHYGNHGLGNLLFTLATGYSTSKTYGKEMYSTRPNGYNEYQDNILRNIKLTNEIPNSIYVEKAFTYDEIPNVEAIDGYFQSEKYFVNHRTGILDLFEMPFKIKDYIDKKYKKLLEGNTCSIHIRRGDYLKNPQYHPIQDLSYYEKAISKISKNNENVKFLVFSDDINWCKEKLKNINLTFIENEKDYIDLYLMSLCKNNIIANSTFSWWSAWLNKNKNKIVIAPSKWFGPAANLDSKDIVPESWEKI